MTTPSVLVPDPIDVISDFLRQHRCDASDKQWLLMWDWVQSHRMIATAKEDTHDLVCNVRHEEPLGASGCSCVSRREREAAKEETPLRTVKIVGVSVDNDGNQTKFSESVIIDEPDKPKPNTETDLAEVAYWDFDARHKGYGPYKLHPQSERDAFKCVYQAALSQCKQSQDAEDLAKRFHEAYERLAPDFGYKTREASAKPWADVPADNKNLMIAVCAEIMVSQSKDGWQIPEGYTLVPIEATEQMLYAGYRHQYGDASTSVKPVFVIRDIYKAMIAAAPVEGE